MKRADAVLLLVCFLAAAACALWFAAGKREGGTLVLSCDGEVIARSSLREPGKDGQAGTVSQQVRYCLLLFAKEGVSCEWYEVRPDLASAVPSGNGYNLLIVSESGVSMEAADCPDQICVHHIPISGAGESIICLPHKLAVEIMGGTDAETLDGMAETGSVNDVIWNGRRAQYALYKDASEWSRHETDG